MTNENSIHYNKNKKSLTIPSEQIDQFFKSFTNYYRLLKGIDKKCESLENLSTLCKDNKEFAPVALKQEICSQKEYIKLLDEEKKYKTCELNEQAKNKELDSFIESISIKYHNLCNPLVDIKNPDSGIVSFDKIEKSKPHLYIPFRLLDGNFNFYFEICVGGSPSCKSFQNGAIGMKTMIGTIKISEESKSLSQGIDFVYPRKYTFISPSGSLAREFIKDLGKFPFMLEERLTSAKKMDVISDGSFEIKTSELVFKYISIKAKYNFTASPASFALKEINNPSETEIDSNPNYDSSIIRVKMELPREQHYCLMSLAKSKLAIFKNLKTYVTNFNQDLTQNVTNILSNADQLTVEKSFLHSTVSEDFVYIDLPEVLKKQLSNTLKYENSYANADFLDIIINTAVYEEELNDSIKFIIKNRANDMVNELKEKISNADSKNLQNTNQYKIYNDILNDLYNGCGPLNNYLQKYSGEVNDGGEL